MSYNTSILNSKMDREEEEELQFIGFSGIYAQSFKIISTWKKLFTQITLTLILPQCFIFLLHSQISETIFINILRFQLELSMVEQTDDKTFRHKISDHLTYEWITLCLFKLAYFTFALIFSLLSTAAVVYTIAAIYTGKSVTFRTVMRVVPKVWKRLIITFLWSFTIFFLYNSVFFLGLLKFENRVDIVLTLILLYTIGLAYLTMVWNMASVVSVLEDVYGLKAVVKSKALIKGKMGVSVLCFLCLVVCFVVVMIVFQVFAVGYVLDMLLARVLVGLACLMVMVAVVLVGLVVQTVVYFVCKSYHRENVDKSVLADRLDVYVGEVYVPLKAKEVQLEQLRA